MNKHFLRLPYMAFLGAITFLVFSGCDKLLPEKFNFPLKQTVTFMLTPMPPVGDVTLATNSFSIDLDSALAAQKIDNYTVSSVKPTSIYLETVAPDGNFDAFASLNTYLSAATLPQTEMAGTSNVPKGVKRLDLDEQDVNVMDYLREKPTTFTIKANLSDSVRTAMDVQVFMEFDMEVRKK